MHEFGKWTTLGHIIAENEQWEKQKIDKENFLLKVGDVIELKYGMRVYTGSNSNEIMIDNFNGYIGKYVVTGTSMSGGGFCGQDNIGLGSYYPNGHRVIAQKMNNSNIVVSFYQTGSFTCMIENIKPIGKAIPKWKMVK